MAFPVIASTTVTSTGLMPPPRSILSGVASPYAPIFTGTVTTVSLPSIFVRTVTIPSPVTSDTPCTVTLPLRFVYSGPHRMPSPPTIVTIAPDTQVPLSVTVMSVLVFLNSSSILSGYAVPSSFTDTATFLLWNSDASASIWYWTPSPPSRYSVTFPPSIVAFCVPTVTVPEVMMGTIPYTSTTIMVTGTIFGFWKSIVAGVGCPYPSIFTGTVTVFSSPPVIAFTVTVQSVSTGTFSTITLPSDPVVFSYFFPLASTIVTVALSTGEFPFTTVIVTPVNLISSIVPSEEGLLLLYSFTLRLSVLLT